MRIDRRPFLLDLEPSITPECPAAPGPGCVGVDGVSRLSCRKGGDTVPSVNKGVPPDEICSGVGMQGNMMVHLGDCGRLRRKVLPGRTTEAA